ncbi:MAG TPA: hypothetical protein VFN56_03225 [Candidatus Saccharimonadales bacterium]|nr:hypothetical protein [Candidatus Saccharimonadales bacterium]
MSLLLAIDRQQQGVFIDPHRINLAAYRVQLQMTRRVGHQQISQTFGSVVRRVQPPLFITRLQDNRHTLVDRSHVLIRRRRQDGIGRPLVPLSITPHTVDPGKREQSLILGMHKERLLAGGTGLPLVKAISGHQASTMTDSVLPQRFIKYLLGAGVERLVLEHALFVFRPGRQKAPTHNIQVAAPRLLHDRGQPLARSQVIPTGHSVRHLMHFLRRNREALRQFTRLMQGISSTHTTIVTPESAHESSDR